MPGALDGIRVLDLSWGIAGPLGVLMLAEQGADTIKVEPPDGDPFRSYSGYKVWTRSRRSVTVDLKSDVGREAFLKLVETADVVVESFRPGVMERLGVGYEACAAVNRRLVYCSVPGYPPGHRLAGRPGLRRAGAGELGPAVGAAGLAARADLPGDADAEHGRDLPRRQRRAQRADRARDDRPRPAREHDLLQGAWLYTTQIWQDIEKADASIYAMMAKTNPPGVHQAMIFECADNEFVHVSVMSGLPPLKSLDDVVGVESLPDSDGRGAPADGGREQARRPAARGVPETQARRHGRRADREQPRGRGDRHARGAVRAPAAGGERHGGDRRRPRPRPDHADRRAHPPPGDARRDHRVRNPASASTTTRSGARSVTRRRRRPPPWRTAEPV